MTLKRVWMAFLLGAVVSACEKNTAGVLQTPPPLAGLRYFDAVPDTGYMDFRIVDIVQYAPNTVRASFRTGGNPLGVATTLPPPYLSVQAGARHIRVFLDSATCNACSPFVTDTTMMFDTTVTFAAGHNYTFILYGSARAKTLHSMVLDDTTMTAPDAGSNIWVRTVNLAADTTGTGNGHPDVFVSSAAAPAGTATFTAPAYLSKSGYVRVAVGALKAYLTSTTTLTPVLVTGTLPAGIVGTTSVNPVAGALVANTAISVIILGRGATGAPAPTFATPGVVFLVDQQPPLTAP